MKAKTFKQIRNELKKTELSPVPNNPIDNELYIDKKGKEEEENFNKKWMLFDDGTYNARKIEEKRTDLFKRMIKGYNKNKNKITNKSDQTDRPQSQKRKEKLLDLTSRLNSWRGLENYNINEGLNEYIRDFRKLYYSGRKLTFREWMNKAKTLTDTLQ